MSVGVVWEEHGQQPHVIVCDLPLCFSSPVRCIRFDNKRIVSGAYDGYVGGVVMTGMLGAWFVHMMVRWGRGL